MMDVMVANKPTPKMPTRVSFSFLGRWIELSVFTGRPNIQKSVRMLNADVTVSGSAVSWQRAAVQVLNLQ